MVASPRPAGFSLVELLVVIGIIGVLLALILPAVQSARESARRVQCTSNLRQIALGVHGYVSAASTFPVNYLPSSNPTPRWIDNSGGKYWSWLSRVLPFIEQQSLYERLNVGSNTLRESESHICTQITVYLCPSDGNSRRGPRLDGDNLGTPPISAPLALGQTNYKGVSGANWNWGESLWSAVPSTIDGSFNGLTAGDGIFFRTDYLKPRRMAALTDGISNTFMVGEDLPIMNTHCSWPYANHTQGTCAIPPNVRRPTGGRYPATDWHNVYSFRSHHPTGLHFAMADGSTRFISASVELNSYRSLSTIAGSELVDVR